MIWHDGLMAQQKRVIVTDDIDGTENAKSYTFAFNGTDYEIDPADATRAQLTRARQPYSDPGRKVRGGPPAGRGASTASTDSKAVREWARANGFTVPDRGRIPKAAQDAYANR